MENYQPKNILITGGAGMYTIYDTRTPSLPTMPSLTPKSYTHNVDSHFHFPLSPSSFTSHALLIGFIASHVVINLVKQNPTYNIVNFDCLDYCSCIENLEEVENEPNYKFVKGDITSSDLVTYVLKQEKVRGAGWS